MMLEASSRNLMAPPLIIAMHALALAAFAQQIVFIKFTPSGCEH
jgi:hypothetical protein